MAMGRITIGARRRPKRRTLAKVALVRAPPRGTRNFKRSTNVKRVRTVRMKYCQGTILNPAALLSTAQFRMNGIFDPDITGIGHQPLGHDIWAQFYERYKVLHYKIKIYITDVTPSTLVVVGLNSSQSGTLPTIASTMCEQASTKYTCVDDFDGARVLTFSQTAWDALGVTKSQYLGEKDYGANFGADPAATHLATMSIFAQHQNQVTAVTVPIWVEMTYTVQLSEPELLLQS